MIVSNLDNNEIKILIDEVDLKGSKISLQSWISEPNKTISYIKSLVENNDLMIKDYSIYTYNYKVFLIVIYI